MLEEDLFSWKGRLGDELDPLHLIEIQDKLHGWDDQKSLRSRILNLINFPLENIHHPKHTVSFDHIVIVREVVVEE